MRQCKIQSSKRIILILFLFLMILSYVFYAPFHNWLSQIFNLFATMNVDKITGYLRSFGPWAVLVSFLLMMLQSVVAPLPAFLLTFANAAIWGWWKGALLSWSSAMAGAILCFMIGRILGRDIVEKITNRLAMEQVDLFFQKYGKSAILICRLLPFISFDFVSYGAGLTAIRLMPFLIATGIGQLPATILYSYIGSMLTGGTKLAITGLMILFALSVFIYLLRKISKENQIGS